MADKALVINWEGRLHIVQLHAVGPVICHVDYPRTVEQQEDDNFVAEQLAFLARRNTA